MLIEKPSNAFETHPILHLEAWDSSSHILTCMVNMLKKIIHSSESLTGKNISVSEIQIWCLGET